MQITYYFGAGASHGALPVVSEIPNRLREMADEFYSLWPDRPIEVVQKIDKVTNSELFNDFSESLRWLADNASIHASVDTFAKKLFVRGEFDLLNRLKAVMSCFFSITQAVKPVDTRYDSFFAALTSRNVANILLPNNVKILSWNYDLQFEYAFAEYCEAEHLIRDLLQSDPKADTLDISKFAIVRLNGLAGLHRNQDNDVDRYLSWLPRSDSIGTILRAFDSYYHNPDQFQPLLNFSWEENIYSRTFIPNALNLTMGTECLVVIGYSFPFFNRDIDRSIVRAMNRLQHVYIQAPKDALDSIRTRFSSIRDEQDLEVTLVAETDQFYLPKEL